MKNNETCLEKFILKKLSSDTNRNKDYAPSFVSSDVLS